MPESPEVHALVEQLGERLRGRVLTGVDVLEFRVVATRAAAPASLVGAALTATARYGKHLDLVFGARHLIVSLGRHGWARLIEPGERPDAPAAPGPQALPPALATLSFDDGCALAFTDAGSWVSIRLAVAGRPEDVAAIAKLGPDPAGDGYARADFDRAFAGRRKQVKAILQEQESIAGIGNAYSDEILHAARSSPTAHASALDEAALARVFEATVATVRDAIAQRRGIPIDRLKEAKIAAMRVHGREGGACPVCGGTIRSLRFASTTAQYCPVCQTEGELLGG